MSGMNATTAALIRAILDIIVKVFLYIGIFFIAWGVIDWLMALKSDNTEAHSNAFKLIITGIALTVMRLIASAVLAAVGFTY